MTIKNVVETITPTIAERYLNTMNGNRKLTNDNIDFLVGQMKSGRWYLTHQGIAFDEEGRLIDGQHRMWAVIESGMEVPMYVARGVPRESVTVLDTGKVRNYAAHAHFNGDDPDSFAAAIARVLVLGPGMYRKPIPHAIVAGWREHYREQIDIALACRNRSRGAGSKVMSLPMASAFARAAFAINPAVLERMSIVLGGGLTDDKKETAAIALRDAWLSKRIGTLVTEQYLKTEAAIRAFADRRPLRNLQRPEAELWEIPPLPRALRYDAKRVGSAKAARERAVVTMHAPAGG